MTTPEATPTDPRWELVERVVGSAAFARSRRLQDLLRFVCTREIRAGKAPTEAEVAAAVFGRTGGFDPAEDTVVRVQASQLRRRLALYFATEGADEPTVLELSHGTYRPVFRRRDEKDRSAPGSRAAAPPRSRALLALSLLCALLASAGLVLLLQHRELRARLHPEGPRPAVDRLWRAMFANGRDTSIVVGDSSLTTFQDLVGVELSPSEYQHQLTILHERVTEPTARGLATQLAKQRYTTLADAKLVAGVVELNTVHGIRADVRLASEAGPALLRSSNVILAGPRRSNPWVELFEERLTFRGRGRFDDRKRTFAFVDTRSRTGEDAEYAVVWGRTGYCRVAYLPNLDRNGSILLVTGSDMSSGEAGAAFITSELWIGQLHDRLGVPRGRALPYFEVLLRTRVVASAISSFELVACRTVTP